MSISNINDGELGSSVRGKLNQLINDSNSGTQSGSFSGSFQGDGSQLTGITAEWDGSHLGDATITGSLIVSSSSPTFIQLGDGSVFKVSNPSGSIFINGSGSATITGSLNITGSSDFSGPVTVSGSITISGSGGVVTSNQTGSFATTSGSNNFSGNVTVTGSLTVSGSDTFTNIGPFSQTGDSTFTGNITASSNISASGNVSGITGSFSHLLGNGSQLTGISAGSSIDTGSLGNTTITGSLTVSGSNTFTNIGQFNQTGNSTFTGNITASGNISASGDIIGVTGSLDHVKLGSATFLELYNPDDVSGLTSPIIKIATPFTDLFTLNTQGDTVFGSTAAPAGGSVTLQNSANNAFLNVKGNITASGNISASAFIGDGSQLTGISAGSSINTGSLGSTTITGSLTVSGSNTFTNIGLFSQTGDSTFTGNITASGNVSSSAASTASFGTYTGPGGHKIEFNPTNLKLISIDGASLELSDVITFSNTDVTIPGAITAGSTISNISTTNITASGNISASGGIFGTNITASNRTKFGVNIGGTTSTSHQFYGQTGDTNFFLIVDKDGEEVMKGSGVVADGNLTYIFGDNGEANNGVLLQIEDGNNRGFFKNASNNAHFGINTNSPGEELEVVGNISASGNITALDLNLFGGDIDLKNAGAQSNIKFYCESANAHYTKLQAAPHSAYSGNPTVTLPAYGFDFSVPNFQANITASGNVSASAFIGDGSQLTNLPASNPFPFTGDAIITGSLVVDASSSTSQSLSVIGSGSTVFDVVGSVGTLFSVDDSLTGTLFSANDISGFPVLQAESTGEVYLGKSPQSLYTTAVVSSTLASATHSLAALSTSSYDGAFFEYTAISSSNARAGSVMSVWNGANIVSTETTSSQIGSTLDLTAEVIISQSQAHFVVYGNNPSYKVKTIIKAI